MLFANDLSLNMPDGVTIVQFADDTQILVTGKKRELANIISLMETALDTAYQGRRHRGGSGGSRPPSCQLGPIFTEFAETHILRQKVIVTLCI